MEDLFAFPRLLEYIPLVRNEPEVEEEPFQNKDISPYQLLLLPMPDWISSFQKWFNEKKFSDLRFLLEDEDGLFFYYLKTLFLKKLSQ